MAFKYIQSSHRALSTDTLQLLEQIDAFPFALIQPRYNTLGDLHATLTVEVVDDAGERTYTVLRTISYIKNRIAELAQEEQQIQERRNQMLDDMRQRQDWSEERFLPVFEHLAELRLLRRTIANNPGKSGCDVVPIDVTVPLAGYYTRIDQEAKVVLVYNEKKEELAITYIHEMMHAYYDSDRFGHSPNVIEYAEEPLAEYGMLSFMNALSGTYPQYLDLFDDACKAVKEKEHSMGVEHYGFGLYLRKTFGHLDWITMMYLAKNKVSVTDADYIKLRNTFQTGYPKDKTAQHDTAQRLHNLLAKACGHPQVPITTLNQQPLTPPANLTQVNSNSSPIVLNQVYKSLYPVYSMWAACSTFLDGEPNQPIGWMPIGGYTVKDSSKFIVQALGHSMEPRIQNGDYCLFQKYTAGSREGKIFLVSHDGKKDSDYEGYYSIRVYHENYRENELGQSILDSIELRPLNPQSASIVISTRDFKFDLLRIVGEFIDTI